MATTRYFTDNTTYGADDMNAAFSHLISSGVTNFDTETALTQSTQDAVAAIASAGVGTDTPGGCLVVETDGIYKVSEGVCFLSDGSHFAVDSGGADNSAILANAQSGRIFFFKSAADHQFFLFKRTEGFEILPGNGKCEESKQHSGH